MQDAQSTADVANMVGGVLSIDVASATSAGQLILQNATTGMSATSITINLTPSANFIASGTALTIVDGASDATLSANTLTATSQGVHRFSLTRTDTDNDIVLNIGRVSTSSLVNSEAGKNLANALDVLANTVTGTLVTVQSNITQATTAAGVNAIVESLTLGLMVLAQPTLA